MIGSPKSELELRVLYILPYPLSARNNLVLLSVLLNLSCVTRGVGHGGAHQPLRVIDKNLESIHILAVNIVDLGIDKVDPRLADSDHSIIDLLNYMDLVEIFK